MRQDREFHVAFVCTGNRCRSPYAAALLSSLTAELPVRVTSEGTLDAPGHAVPKDLVEIARGRKIQLASHQARPLSPRSLEHADLVVGFSFDHVAASVIHGGADRSVTFTLPELARLLIEVDAPEALSMVERAREVVRRADATRRERRDPVREMADPFGGPRHVYETMAQEIDTDINVIAERLFGIRKEGEPRS